MKLGILGAGSIAGVMAKTVRLLNQNGHPEIELYAVAARQADRAEAFARANGVQRAYGGYEAMLADPAVDLVYIATPHSHHYGQIRMCVAYGKHVLCEKAFTVNARQAEAALREARDRGLLVTEAIWTRYQPMRRRIREVVEYLPMDRILLETDCPYLAPEPNRGKRNSSLNLPFVIRQIAEIKGIDPQEVEEITCRNAKEFFRIGTGA